ncbi:hypothetical protein D3C78_1262450 [compost metagenome]
MKSFRRICFIGNQIGQPQILEHTFQYSLEIKEVDLLSRVIPTFYTAIARQKHCKHRHFARLLRKLLFRSVEHIANLEQSKMIKLAITIILLNIN